MTKALDSTRPCIDTSGYVHVETDIFDTHDYEQNTETFRKNYEKLITDGELYDGQRIIKNMKVSPFLSASTAEYSGQRIKTAGVTVMLLKLRKNLNSALKN